MATEQRCVRMELNAPINNARMHIRKENYGSLRPFLQLPHNTKLKCVQKVLIVTTTIVKMPTPKENSELSKNSLPTQLLGPKVYLS